MLATALLALALTGVGLGGRSLWLDEGATVAIASQHGAALWHAIAHDGGNMLLYYLLEHVLIGWFGAGPVAIRLPSAIADGVTAGLVAALALRLFRDGGRPRIAALAAGVLTAVSLPLVFWGQDARGYSLMVALACASWLAFVALLDRPSSGVSVAYVLCTAAAIYVGFDAALIVAAQLAVVALGPARERAGALGGCLVAVALACVPLAVLALDRGSGQLFWVPGLGGPVLGQAGTTLLSAGLSPNFHYTATTTATAVLSGLLVVAACAAVTRPGTGWRPRVPALWLAVPVVLGLLAAVAGEPIELARAAVLLIPAVALLVAWLLFAAPRGPARWGGPLVIAGLLALRALQLAPSYGTSPEDWKAAAAYVVAHSPAHGACVAFYPQDGRMPFDAYVRGTGAATARLTPVLPAVQWSRVQPFVERYSAPGRAALAAIQARCPVLWLVASHQGQPHATAASAANLHRYGALLAALGHAYRGHSDHRFGYAAVVRVTRFGP